MSEMLEEIHRTAVLLGNRVDKREARDPDENPIDILVIHHGTHSLIAIDSGTYVTLTYQIDIPEKDAQLLSETHEDIQRRLVAILKREMLEGRSGYRFEWSEDDPPLLRRIRIDQKLLIVKNDPQSAQRLADGIQELVVVGIRSIEVLGQAFSDVRFAASTSSAPADYMYG